MLKGGLEIRIKSGDADKKDPQGKGVMYATTPAVELASGRRDKNHTLEYGPSKTQTCVLAWEITLGSHQYMRAIVNVESLD